MKPRLTKVIGLVVVMLWATSVEAEQVELMPAPVKNKQRNTIVKMDINAGAERMTPGRHGWTELMEAALKGNTATVKVLLNKKGDVNAKSDADETALMVAAYYGHIDIVRALLNAGADVNVKNISGRTALSEAVDRGHMAILQILINNGANVNMEGILEAASVRGQTEIVHALLNKGADVNKYGGAALISASWKGHTAIVEALLSKGANVNARTGEGRTALMLAAEEGHTATVETLLAGGADVDAKSDYKFGYGETALLFAASRGHTGVVQTLLTKGATVDAKTNDGKTALMLAAEKGYTPVVQALIAKGINVNYKNKYGSTALMSASQKGYEDTVQILLKNSADVKVEDNDGQTALVYADVAGYKNIVKILIERQTPPAKAVSLLYIQQEKNRCNIKMWDIITQLIMVLYSLKDCPKDVYVDERTNTLFIITETTIQEIVFMPTVLIKTPIEIPLKIGEAQVDEEKRWDNLKQIGYLKNGRLAVVNERVRPADDSDIFLYEFDKGKWALVKQRYCGRFEDCIFNDVTGRHWSVWKKESQIWHPMLSLNPSVVDRGKAQSTSRELYTKRGGGDWGYIKISVKGHQSILYHYSEQGEHSFGLYTSSIYLKTYKDKKPIEVCNDQCDTAVGYKYLLLSKYFGKGLELIDLETGKRVLKELKFAFWIY